MSEILSYSNNTSKSGEEDWIGHAPYSDDDIARIKDPDGGLSENPRTAIPSPLAQLDLVKNAFKQLANERLRGARMNERLVSNALDVAQLFFDYENHKDYLRIIRWNREECLEQLKANPQHRPQGLVHPDVGPPGIGRHVTRLGGHGGTCPGHHRRHQGRTGCEPL